MALPLTITGGPAVAARMIAGPFRIAQGPLWSLVGTPSDDIYTAFGDGINKRAGQTFIAQGNATIGAIKLRVHRTAAIADGVSLNIYAVDGNGFPTGPSLASCTLSGGNIDVQGSPAGWAKFVLDAPLAVTNGTIYAVVLNRSGADHASVHYRIYGTTTDVHVGGRAIYETNALVWNASPAVDMNLIVLDATPSYYFFGRDASTFNTLGAWHAKDPSVSWEYVHNIAMTAIVTPGTGIIEISAARSSTTVIGSSEDDIIHLGISGLNGFGSVEYAAFDMSKRVFDISSEVLMNNQDIRTSGSQACYHVSIVMCGNRPTIFYNGPRVQNMGTPYSQTYERHRTGVNTWSTAVQVSAGGQVDFYVPDAVAGVSNSAHFIYKASGGTVWVRTITSSYALQTAVSSTSWATAQLFDRLNPVSYNDGGTWRVFAASRQANFYPQVLRFDSANVPTLAINTVDSNASHTSLSEFPLYADGGNVWMLRDRNSDRDVYAHRSTDDGVSWALRPSTPVMASAAINFFGGDAEAYQRGNTFVLGYIVGDNTVLKYNEHVTRYVTQADAWDPNDVSLAGRFTFSNGDKTAITAAAGTSEGVRSVQGRQSGTAGKYYVEWKYDTLAGVVTNGWHTNAAVFPNSTSAFSVQSDGGNVSIFGVPKGGSILGAFATGDVLCGAWDAGAKLVWFRKNGGNWNNDAAANPATGVGGHDTSAGGTEIIELSHLSFQALNNSTSIRTEIADFTLTPPIGYLSWMGEVITTLNAWSATDKNPTTTLSNGDKTITAGTGSGAARSTKTYPSSGAVKLYAEIVFNPAAGASHTLGIHDLTTMNWSTGLFEPGTKSFGYYGNSGGAFYLDGTSTGYGGLGNFANGDVVSIAWDTVNKRAWIRKNGGNWNNSGAANPATNVGGADTSAWTASMALIAEMGATSASATIRTEKAEFGYTAPSGFLSWMGETLIVPDSGTLAASAATVAGAGVARHHGTGTLVAQSPTLTSNNAISSSTGTGAMVAVGYSRTNYALNTEAFNLWAATFAQVVTNDGTAPNATLTAERLTDTPDNGPHFLQQVTPAIPAGRITYSVYIKVMAGTWIQVRANDGAARYSTFNVAAGNVGTANSGDVTTAMTSVGNGWHRCSISWDHTAGGTAIGMMLMVLLDDSNNYSFAGTGRNFWVWGSQVELSPAPTAYLPNPSTTLSVSVPETMVGIGTASWNATGALVPFNGMRTNRFLHSQAAENAFWSPVDITVTANAATAPDGTVTADRITEATGNNEHYFEPMYAIDNSAGGVQTLSIYAKWVSGVAEVLQLYTTDGTNGVYANFNLRTGALGAKSAIATSLIEFCGSGWYRCSVTGPSASTATQTYIGLQDAAQNTTYPQIGSDILVWGAQHELGTRATSYLVTTTGAVSTISKLLWGAGAVTTPPAIGTGALTTGVADLDAFGSVHSTGTAALVAANRTLTGVGVSQVVATGALQAIAVSRIANLIKYSQAVDQLPWMINDVTVTANAAMAPDGTTTAERITDAATNNYHPFYQQALFPVSNTGQFTLSIYAKAGSLDWITLQLEAQWGGFCSANFNIRTGTIGAVGGFPSATITPAANGFFRCSINIGAPPPDAVYTAYFMTLDSNRADPQYLGTGTGTIEVWGAQLEEGNVVTAYVPTTNAFAYISQTISGVGTSSSRSTSAALQATMLPLQNGVGISSSEGGSDRYPQTIIDGARTDTVFGTSTGTRTITQTFISLGQSVTTLNVFVSKVGAPSDSLRARVYRVDAAHKPTGTSLAISNLISGSSLPTGAGVARTFTFTPPVGLVKDVEYAVLFERSSTLSNTNHYSIAATTDTFVNGQFGYSTSGGFFVDPVRDLVVTINQIEGGLPAQAPSINGYGIGPAWVGFGALVPQPRAISPIDQGATTHIDFLHGPIGYVQGTGYVGIETLLGSADEDTAYYPAALTAWGYDPRSIGMNNPPAALGALKDAMMGGGSVVVKLQANADEYPSGDIEFYYYSADYSKRVYIYSNNGYLIFDVGVSSDLVLADCFPSPEVQGHLNVAGFLVINSARIDLAANNVASQTGPITDLDSPPEKPFVLLTFNSWGPIASITTYPTLPLAELQAKTVQILDRPTEADRLVGSGSVIWLATGALASAPSIVGSTGFARWSASGTMPAQGATLAGVGVSSSRGTGVLPQMSYVPADATVYINFIGNVGYVQGTGNVPINTLFGHYEGSQDISGSPTGYDPSFITQYGYEVSKSKAFVPALLGPLLDAVCSGKSVVFRYQSVGVFDPGYNYNDIFTFSDSGYGPWIEGYEESGVGHSNVFTNGWTMELVGGWNPAGTSSPVPGVINAQGFTILPLDRVDVASNDISSGTHALIASDIDGVPNYVELLTYWGAIASIAVYDTLSLAALQAKTIPVLDAGISPYFATMTGLGSAVTGVGGTGAFAVQSAVAVGAGISRSVGTPSAMGSQAAIIVAPGVGQSFGSGALVVPGVATLAGVGGVASVGTAALNPQAAVAVGAGIARHVATGALAAQSAVIVSSGVIIAAPSGTGTLVAQPAVIVAAANVRWIATGALAAQATSITAPGNVRWSGTGAMVAGVAAVAGAGVSSSSVTSAALVASLAQVEGWEGAVVVAGLGAMVAQSHDLVASGGVLSSGTGALIDAAPALAGAGLSRSLGTGAPISQTSVISATGVSRAVGTGAIIPTTAAVVAGAGVIIPAPSGTGALSSGVASVAGLGVAERVMTGVLVAQNRVMSSTGGVSRSVGTGAILGTEAALAGVAVGTSRGTGALVTFSTLAGAGQSRVEGTGALSSGVAAVAGTAVATQLGSGALTSSSAAVSGAGFVQHVIGATSLAAGSATVTAGGLSSSTATAPLQAAHATVVGVQGVVIGIGTGSLQGQSRLVAGAGLSRSFGTGSLSVDDSSTVNAVGESDSRGSGELGCPASTVEGLGEALVEGTGALASARAILASTGGAVRWAGSGALVEQNRTLTGVGRVIALGTGTLQSPTAAEVTGTGSSFSRGSGNLVSKRAQIFGSAFLSTLGFGELQAQSRKLTGVGKVLAFGVGILRQARPTLAGVAISRSRGFGTIITRSAQLHGFGVETAYGSGTLVSTPVIVSGSNLIEGAAVIDAAPAEIVGVGEVTAYVAPPPDDLPGSYPGTALWSGYTRPPSQLPKHPWWLRRAA